MGWERRGGRSYYYRKQRSGGQVTSVYIPYPFGKLAALEDAQQAVEREAKQEEEQAERAAAASHDANIAAYLDLIDGLTTAALLLGGAHKVKGEWRRKRE